MRLLAIIPAFNEEEALPALLDELRALPSPPEIVVVDDGSADRTAEVARAKGARVVRLCGNLGIGGAVQAGLQLAHREGFDAAIQIDGDGQHPPAEVAKLVARAAAADVDLVVGTRFGGTTSFRSTFFRRVGIGWLRGVLRVVGVRVTDPTSGFRLYGKRALALFHETYPYDYPEPESLAVARAARLAIAEVPVAMRERQGGRSSIAGLYTAYYMWKVTLAVILAFLRTSRRPHGAAA